MIAYRLCSSKPLSKQMPFCQLNPKKHISVNWNQDTTIFIQENSLNKSSAFCRFLCFFTRSYSSPKSYPTRTLYVRQYVEVKFSFAGSGRVTHPYAVGGVQEAVECGTISGGPVCSPMTSPARTRFSCSMGSGIRWSPA